MQSILETLFGQHNLAREPDPAALQRIASNAGMLKKGLNPWQKKRLLGIIDDKDLLAYQWASESFVSGLRFGILLMSAVLDEQSFGAE